VISKEKPVMLASSSEKADLDRLMLIWANQFPGIPENVDLIKYEYFAAKTVGMALSSVQGAVITKKYICGGYQAEYSFEVHYQIAPPGTSDDKRLKAVETLNKFADWAQTQRPNIGEGRRALRVETVALASYLGATNDQYEDYIVPLKLIYEVNI
jgi:hypothetical protein